VPKSQKPHIKSDVRTVLTVFCIASEAELVREVRDLVDEDEEPATPGDILAVFAAMQQDCTVSKVGDYYRLTRPSSGSRLPYV
jgi:hypothetical protein